MKSRPGPGTVMQRLEAACRSHGLPLTVQRRAVLEALASRRDLPTADLVYEDVARRLPGVSRATVYRVLEVMVRAGVVRKVWYAGAAARFEVPHRRHHHLVCVVCDRVVDVDNPALDRLPGPGRDARGFRLLDYSVQFMGVCPECAGKGRAPRRQSSRRMAHEGK
ncbi:MAG: Fur family transcriptional regulator [Bryobacteraceae bacterium]